MPLASATPAPMHDLPDLTVEEVSETNEMALLDIPRPPGSEIFFETIQPLRFNDNKDCKASKNQQALKEYSLSLALAQSAISTYKKNEKIVWY